MNRSSCFICILSTSSSLSTQPVQIVSQTNYRFFSIICRRSQEVLGPVGIVSNIERTGGLDPCVAVAMWREEPRLVPNRLLLRPAHGFLLTLSTEVQ